MYVDRLNIPLALLSSDDEWVKQSSPLCDVNAVPFRTYAATALANK